MPANPNTLHDLERELSAIERELTELQRTHDAYCLVIARHRTAAVQGLPTPPERGFELLPEPLVHDVNQSERVTAPSSARTALVANPHVWMTVDGVRRAMEALGWTTSSSAPNNVVRNTLFELTDKGEAEKRKDASGLLEFRYLEQSESEAPAL